MDFIQLSNQLGLGLFGDRPAPAGQADFEQINAMSLSYIEGMNNGNIDQVMDVFADSFVDHQVVPGGGTLGSTKADVRNAHEMLHVAFPDVRFDLLDLLIDGDKVVMRVHGEGTHQGAFFGMPPSGRYIKWSGVRLLRYENGKFVEGNSELDQVGILQQMGILPVAPIIYNTEGNKAVVRNLIDELNRGNVNAYDCFMPDVTIHFESSETPLQGVTWLTMEDAQLRAAFHDLHMEIDSQAAMGDKVATRIKFSGTHSGEYMGVPGTGQEYHWSGMVTDRFVDDRIVERWTNIDRFTLLQQVGIIPRFG
jgi:predicted ester cyclase